MNAPVSIKKLGKKPVTVSGDLARLPDVFKPYLDRKVWLCWKWKWDGRRWTKPPFKRTGWPGSSTNANDWCTHQEAVAAFKAGKVDGIGIALTGLSNGEIALDLDNCRNPLSGEIEPWAQEIVIDAASYTEISPSGEGLRVIGFGDVSAHTSFEGVDGKDGGVEIFTAGQGRYIVVTGAELPGCWPHLSDVSLTTRRLIEGKGKLHPLVEADKASGGAVPLSGRQSLNVAAPSRDSSSFFRKVNEAVLAHLSDWVPGLLTTAKFQPGTGAWRVSSTDLGRDLEEDLSIHPSGITDFGTRKNITAIDLVMEHGGAADSVEASLWLCERCGIDPVSLGWRSYGVRHQTSGKAKPQSNADAAEGESREAVVGSDGLILNAKGNPIACLANVLTLLRSVPEWQGVMALDRMAARVMLLAPIPDAEGRKPNAFQPRPIIDGDIVKATEWFQRRGLIGVGKDTVGDAINLVAEERGFDPLEDKLRTLVWDGVPRIENWLLDFCGAEVTATQPEAYIKAVGRCWLISAAARALRPGCKVDSALVLVGPQGIGKSTAGRILAYGDWFSDTLPPVHSKDASDHLRGVWIVEFGEMATASRADVEEMKAFITRTTERFRPAYGRMEIEYPRRNVFMGTTNRDAFLKDDTGNRRFWPVEVTEIDAARLEAERDQLWAEAVNAFDKGKQWHLTAEEAELANDRQAAFVITDEREQTLARKLAGRQAVSSIECLDLLEMPHDKKDQMAVGNMLRSLGWTRKSDGKRKFWVAPLTTSPDPRWSVPTDDGPDFG